jgi:hypothetical protein
VQIAVVSNNGGGPNITTRKCRRTSEDLALRRITRDTASKRFQTLSGHEAIHAVDNFYAVIHHSFRYHRIRDLELASTQRPLDFVKSRVQDLVQGKTESLSDCRKHASRIAAALKHGLNTMLP